MPRPLVNSRPPIWTLDLSRPPEQRWTGVMDLFEMPWKETWEPIFQYHNASLFHIFSEEQFATIARAVERNFPEQAGELRSISNEFTRIGYPVSYNYLATWAYSHELSHMSEVNASVPFGGADPAEGCLGILAQDSDGNVHHVALMDQDPVEIRWVVLQVRIVRANELLCEGSDWYWFTTGMTRMVRKGVASLQENWRTGPQTVPPARVFQDIEDGVTPQTWVFRQTLTTASLTDFYDVVAHLSTMRLGAEYYVIVGGTKAGEGAVFARAAYGENGGLSGLRATAGPGVEYLSTGSQASAWYLVQGNFDRWVPDPSTDPRLTYAEAALAEWGQERGSTLHGLVGIGNVFPIRNPRTSHLAIMDTKAGTLDSFLFEPMITIDTEPFAKRQINYALINPRKFFSDPKTIKRIETFSFARMTSEGVAAVASTFSLSSAILGFVLGLATVAFTKRQGHTNGDAVVSGLL